MMTEVYRSVHDSLHVMSAPELQVIEVSDGAELTLRLWRTSSAFEIPVLLLHGLSQQGQFWAPVVNRLSAGTVAALDQRGHGGSDVPLDFEFTIPRCALDVAEICAALGWGQVILVGHSWGASVAISAAAEFPELIRAIALIDGGLWGPADLAESIGREATLERLRPPQLAMTSKQLWQMLESGPMATWWSDETRSALEPTFRPGADGLLRSTLGLERHLRVLAGMLEYSADLDLRTIDCPIWAVLCESGGMELAERALARAAATPSIRLQRWQGAVHDVPLQWPAMVAGLIDTVVETEQLAFQKGGSL
ncbi:MAG: hypothetical protein CK552_01815 [Actinobacteria bacterium]|nr:MAG: hypothetical protein CK552_01815 [Actinomycetota bacterium]